MGRGFDVPSNLQRLLLGSVFNQSGTGVTNGLGTDVSKLIGRVNIGLAVGNRAGTAPTLDVKFQDSDDDDVLDPYADIPGAFFPQVTTEGIFDLPMKIEDVKKFVRPVLTIGGSAGVKWTIIIAMMGMPLRSPAA